MKKFFAIVFSSVFAVFFAAAFFACGNDGTKVKVYMPDGAPAIALSGLMDSGYADTEFIVVGADVVEMKFANDGDMAIMPINKAAALYNRGVDMVMLSVNTHGNLYIVGAGGISLLRDLIGKKLGVIGQGAVPDLTLRMLLDECEVPYVKLDETVQDKIALRYTAGASELLPLLRTGAVDYALLGEPAATTACDKFGKSIVIDLQEEWKLSIGGQYPQACLVVKGSFLDSRKDYVKDFMSALTATDDFAKQNPDKALAAISSHMDKGLQTSLASLTADIVARCNIKTVSAVDAYENCKNYFKRLAQMTDSNIAVLDRVPDLEFYYQS